MDGKTVKEKAKRKFLGLPVNIGMCRSLDEVNQSQLHHNSFLISRYHVIHSPKICS